MELKQLEKLKKEYQVLHEKYLSLKKAHSEQETVGTCFFA